MNIVDMPERNEMVSALEGLKRNISTIIEYQEILAKLKKAKFDSLVEAGFTEEQAIELCRGSEI